MAQITNVRRFNGTTDKIQLNPVDFNGVAIGAMSWCAIAKHNGDTNYEWVVSLSGGSGGEWGLGHSNGGNAISLWSEGAGASSTSPPSYTSGDGWCLVGVTKADGTATPRFHRYRYSDGNVGHTDFGSTITETTQPAGASLWLGTYDGSSEFWDGDIACVGVWNGTALTDAQFETLAHHIAAWQTLSPTGLWLLNQESVSKSVYTAKGLGEQVAITGTSVVTPSGLIFDAGDAYSNLIRESIPVAYYRMDEAAPSIASVLDNFTGSDETPITTNWTAPLVTGDGSLRRLSNQLAGSAGGWAGGYYDLATYGPDCESYITLISVENTGKVWARVQNPGTATPDGYACGWDTGNTLYLQRIDDGAVTQLGSKSVTSVTAVRVRCIGSRIEGWVMRSGVWERHLVAWDTTYQSAGYIGVELHGTTGSSRADDFGGGTITAASIDMPLDHSGKGNHTTFASNGAVAYRQAGPKSDLLGMSLDYDLDQGFSAPDNSTLDLGDTVSLEAWVKRTGDLGQSMTIFSKGASSYHLFLDNSPLGFGLAPAGGTTFAKSTVELSSTGVWYHIVATKTGSTVKLYLNGADVTGTVTNSTLVDTATDLYICHWHTGGSSITGIVSELAVYPTALSAATVLAHYVAGREWQSYYLPRRRMVRR